jgi:transcriptional regulator with XRE-family HTH domain
MLSDTLNEGLQAYAIGPKIRALRLKKSMGLVELGRHCGLSPALLSKIERGRLHPTLPTLLRVALVFSVGLEYFFEGMRDMPVVAIVRKKDRLKLPESPGSRRTAYQFESLDFPVTERKMSTYFAEFFPVAHDELRRHRHAGAELLFVVKGSLAVHLGESEHVLATGDSMYFDSSVPHAYQRRGARQCHAVVVTSA